MSSLTHISEKNYGNEIFYEKTFKVSGKNTFTSLIRIKTGSCIYDGKEYFLLYDTSRSVCRDAFRFLNFACANISRNTKIKTLEALKFLKAFEEIADTDIQAFSFEEVGMLKDFLYGCIPPGESASYSFNLKTKRNAATVNGYLSVYRNYLTYLGIQRHPLLEKNLNQKISGAYESPYRSTPFKSSDNIPRPYIEVPEYISYTEYERILNNILEHHSLRDYCIVRLMYEYGFRIGEVLGLTSDDILEEELSDGDFAYAVYIRNRASDARDQIAKGCMNVTDSSQYALPSYNIPGPPGGGYQRVFIDRSLFDSINEYIETAHEKATSTESGKIRYQKESLADRVRMSEPYENPNFYIFLNKWGTPMHQNTWNTRLRQIFKECGIPLDKCKKEHNLSHRFRHGFAMFHVQYCGTNDIELAAEMRHSNTDSVSVYYKATAHDQIDMKTRFAEKLHEMIPELKPKH